MLLVQGKLVEEIYRQPYTSEAKCWKWCQSLRRYEPELVEMLKKLKMENARLKRLVAHLALDNRVLKDVAEGNFQALNRSGVAW